MFIYAFTAVKCEYVHVLMNTQYHTYNSLSDCVCACVCVCDTIHWLDRIIIR